MTETTRRLIIGTALASILVAIASDITMKVYEPDWNHGGHPKEKEHPGKSVNDKFNPQYVMLLYLDIEDMNTGGDLRMRAVRLQFPVQGYNPNNNGSNTWKQNKVEITNWIKCLNYDSLHPPGPNPSPNPSAACEWPEGERTYVKKEGLEKFIFNQAHHFVIYIQNKNIEYNETDPVWFGKLLGEVDTNGNHKKANKNWSFFAARVITPTTADDDMSGTRLIAGENSPRLIYMKNFYQGQTDFGGYHDIGDDKRFYSLSINASLPATTLTGAFSVKVPIILDPDTGNMGGGDPPKY